ncbi:uncharacterized protein [Physcomitrium patens]|uniref:uncharacterized protein isoform X1 n=1 Tax=Physcomitrium patens TaxID=3218 RepID=UPI003CCD9786
MFKGNIFGGVTLDKASMLTRSIAMLPSASTGESSLGVDEPIHGLALSIAGQEYVGCAKVAVDLWTFSSPS